MTLAAMQEAAFATEDLTPYRGAWVALRSGRVVASSLGPFELRENPAVRKDDVFLLVPSDPLGTFML